ncbi:Allantoate deiminase 1, partial [Linum perenne]
LISAFLLHVLVARSDAVNSRRSDLYVGILKDEAVSRLRELGKVSDADGYLERTFMSPASLRAADLIRGWMEDAGLTTWIDLMGNVHGRVDGVNRNAEALLIGSHLDTVIDAGIFDGSLGIVSAISALKVLKTTASLEKLKRPVEIIAFSDEEGVRFQSTFLGSAALAGVLPVSALKTSDKSGATVQDVLKENSFAVTEEILPQLKYDPNSVWGYVEIHIEQGPVLEWAGFPVGVVKGIAGQTRLKVTVRGSQGHAGTVPMSMRQDPMAAAAELIVKLETICKNPKQFLSYDSQCSDATVESLSNSLVCTVGEISTWPSASNVIPGQHDANAALCDLELSSQLKVAANAAVERMTGEVQDDVPVLMSGAGHDAMAMAHLTKVGMLFVRCRGGVSHSPAEHVLDDDVWAAGLAILAFLETQIVNTN